MEPILEVKNLTKHFKNFSLDNISFNVEKGYIMGLIGSNGAGKSTTIRLIMNLLKKDGGEIKLFGKDHQLDEKEVKQRIGFVYDENHYYEDLKIDEVMRIIAPFYRKWSESTYKSYIDKFQLPSGTKIKDLSKGMKMKFSLAIALSHEAELIIMDEPTSGLDPIIRSELLDILYELIQDENKGILFSTHNTSDLDKIADYITFLHNGKLVFSQSKDEIMDDYQLVKGGSGLLNENLKKCFIGIKEHQYGFEGLMKKAELNRLSKDQVILERPTLEEIMLYTVRGVNHV